MTTSPHCTPEKVQPAPSVFRETPLTPEQIANNLRDEIKRLKKKQEHLKDELYSAKSRINSDPDRWSYELHTEASGLDPTDPNFVEAFEKETVILDKRVQACKSHVVFSTSFMNRKSSEDRKRLGAEYNRSQGCTADCEPYGQAGPELASTARSQSTGQL